MIVVADSGSTKADWLLIGPEQTERVQTMGFNPIYHDSDLIQSKLQDAFASHREQLSEVSAVYYYGTAIWDDRKKAIIAEAVRQVFEQAAIDVEHDLLGAARATCGDAPGIACIIGTGSNTCAYDGQDIVDNVTNLGYFLGDEGSGAHLGKNLVRAYFYRELPTKLSNELEKEIPGGKVEILDNVYGKSSPNVYLASLTKFLGAHREHFYIKKLIYDSFAEFIDRHVRKYPKHLTLPIHFIGSVAYHFQEFLQVVLEERNMQVGKFIRKPVDSLAEYHKTQL